jgi:membrane protein DedA with SNARE-associated domain
VIDPAILIARDVLGWTTSLLDRWGYWIVFFGVMLENAGIPVPGETVLLAAGFFASRGHLSVVPVMSLAAAGAVVGDNCGYWIGRKLGRRFLVRFGKYVLLTRERLSAMDRFFEKHGSKAVAIARFVTGMRVFTALFAGASNMEWPPFLLFNLIGAIAWSVTICLLGYFFGQSFGLLERWVSGAGLALAIGLAVILLAKLFIFKKNRREGGDSSRVQDTSQITARASSPSGNQSE